MNKKQIEIALAKTARKNGVTKEEIAQTIQGIIDKNYDSDNPNVRKIWRNMTPDGRKPTMEEFLEYFYDKVGDNIDLINPDNILYS